MLSDLCFLKAEDFPKVVNTCVANISRIFYCWIFHFTVAISHNKSFATSVCKRCLLLIQWALLLVKICM